MHPLTRLHRTTIVGRLAARLYLLYKLPEWGRRLRGLPKATEAELAPLHATAAEAILATALRMRGVIIKLCQAIATRADVFPPEFVEKLKECHDAVPPKPFAVVKEAVERELGKPLDAVFSAFDNPMRRSASPLAAVSRSLTGRRYLRNSLSTSSRPRSIARALSFAFSHARIFPRAREVRAKASQSRLGRAEGPLRISTMSPFCSSVRSGTIRPLTFAPDRRWPTSVWMPNAKSTGVAPRGKERTFPFGVNV